MPDPVRAASILTSALSSPITYISELLPESPDLQHGFMPDPILGTEFVRAAGILTGSNHTQQHHQISKQQALPLKGVINTRGVKGEKWKDGVGEEGVKSVQLRGWLKGREPRRKGRG